MGLWPWTCADRSEPLVQSSPLEANVFIWMSFLVALFNYIRFAREIIWQMCVYPAGACPAR